MPGKASNKRDLDDIQVLGVWNFTIQPETPLVWLRTGPLDRYLLKFNICSEMSSTAGMIFHSEADGPGIDGVSFWIERRMVNGEMTRRYVLAGDGLESKPLATRKYPDPGGDSVEDVEVLVQGFTAVIFVRDRKVQIRARMKSSRGSICFFNSTKATEDGLHDDVHFSNCRITALRRGPLEVGGNLARRERALNAPPEAAAPEEAMLEPDGMAMADFVGDEEKAGGFHESVATTAAPESPGNSMQLKSGATTFYKTASPSPSTKLAANGGFRNTSTTRGAFGKSGPPGQMKSSAMFSGRSLGQTRMRPSMSDSALRKSGSALCGLSPASQVRGFGGDEWLPLAMNPPKSEQQFIREHAIRPLPASRTNTCQDFIKM